MIWFWMLNQSIWMHPGCWKWHFHCWHWLTQVMQLLALFSLNTRVKKKDFTIFHHMYVYYTESSNFQRLVLSHRPLCTIDRSCFKASFTVMCLLLFVSFVIGLDLISLNSESFPGFTSSVCSVYILYILCAFVQLNLDIRY